LTRVALTAAALALAGCGGDFAAPKGDARQPMAAAMAQCARAESSALRLADAALNAGGERDAALAALSKAGVICVTAADEVSRLRLPADARQSACVTYLRSKDSYLAALGALIQAPTPENRTRARDLTSASVRAGESCTGKPATAAS